MGYLNLGHSRWGERFPALGKNWTAALLQAVVLAALAFGLGHPKPANAQTVTLAQPSVEQMAKIGAIFDWAHAQPSIFPYLSANVATQTAQGYVFRGYPTGNYLAATATDLYAYGPATNFALRSLGKVDDFYCMITACPQPQRYTDKVYAIWTGNQIFAVTKSGVALVTNKTSYTAGGYPLFNCWLAKTPMADGMVLAACQDAFSGKRHYFYLDPRKDEIYDYTGQVPAKLLCQEQANGSWICPVDHEWVSLQETTPNGAPADAEVATKVTDGWYLSTHPSGDTLYFVDSSGKTITVAKIGGVVRLLITFSF